MMARLARVIAIGLPHHVTQRGIARGAVFPTERSRQVYLALLREHSHRHQLRILGYCLMTNHVHLLAVPDSQEALAQTLRYVHGRFAQYANAELNRSGHLWQNRYYSCPVEQAAVDRVLGYIERNPVRAGLVEEADQFPWSSAAAHTGAGSDGCRVLDLRWWSARERQPGEWRRYLGASGDEGGAIRRATFTGRPLGSDQFVQDLERRLSRKLQRQKPGPKATAAIAAGQGNLFG